MSKATLFEPMRFGAIEMKNRIVLAPLTRSRANEHGVPSELAATYYAQRAQAGLLITEATQVSFEGMGYPRTPGIHTDAQVAAWSKIVEAVHAVGGRIVVQLWHVGRVANGVNRGTKADTVAPSAIQLPGQMYTDAAGMQDHDVPRALETDEIARIAREYARAAERAMAAGFDGVEFHSANGYLMHQFLAENTNRRTDRYGGSIENRVRAPLEVLDAILSVVPADRVGVRVSPGHGFNDITEGDTSALYRHYAGELSRRGLSYLHIMRPFASAAGADPVGELRSAYEGRLIACGGYDAASAAALVEAGGADAVAFGQLFIANPDLPLRLKLGAPLAAPDSGSFYTPGAAGYTDYPVWSGSAG